MLLLLTGFRRFRDFHGLRLCGPWNLKKTEKGSRILLWHQFFTKRYVGMVTYRLQIPCWGLVQRSCRSFSWCVDTSCWVNGMRIPQTRHPFNSPEKCSTMPETAWKLPITNVESVELYTSLYWFLENKHQRFDYNNGLGGGITPSRRDLHCKYV